MGGIFGLPLEMFADNRLAVSPLSLEMTDF